MRILGKYSVASLLKILVNLGYGFTIFFFSALILLFTFIFFFHGPEYDIHGWTIRADVPASAFEVRPLDPAIKVLELQIENPKIGFTTPRSWETITIRYGSTILSFLLMLAFFRHLRRITTAIAANNPFTAETVCSFRRLSLYMLAGAPLTLARETAISLYIRSHFEVGTERLHFGMWSLGTLGDILEGGVMVFVFLGLCLLVMAEIFRIGFEYKQDSQSIV